MSARQATDKAPTITNTWIRLLLSVSVSVAVGLAPYLGKVAVPLFTPLLALFPRSIADVSIIFSTTTMGLVAAYVQFHGSDAALPVDIEGKFASAIKLCICLLALLATFYFVTVTTVQYQYHGGTASESFVTGFTGSRDSRCSQISSAQCIVDVTHFDETAIDSAFWEQQIRLAKALLVILYVGFMSAFAYVAGLIVLRQTLKHLTRTNLTRSPETANTADNQ
jgi:hypothetical protein